MAARILNESSGTAHSLGANSDPSIISCVDRDADLRLGLDFSPAERAVLLAGGLLAQVRTGGRTI
ncbi:hypothetical protein [Arthrobacter sp. B1805]|uniref:hypothetical protein n=1 Tax=Arthrobacter sp. B1805 TaxID=2058892 RepID=UPI0011B0E5FF|nr:hypothetical protein [Arthrobacter sp. B1805]